MINNRPWIALFSHTGSEIVKISKITETTPDLIVTNKTNLTGVHKDIKSCKSVKSKPSVRDYKKLFGNDNPIITMHGWMRIVPPEICEQYDIYNLHPGLITESPELKGKDPQQKVFEMLNMPQNVGCVIHKASAEVDSGEIIMTRRTLNHFNTVNILTDVLHNMATEMWVEFFQNKLFNRF